jgi:hypothetical protein
MNHQFPAPGVRYRVSGNKPKISAHFQFPDGQDPSYRLSHLTHTTAATTHIHAAVLYYRPHRCAWQVADSERSYELTFTPKSQHCNTLESAGHTRMLPLWQQLATSLLSSCATRRELRFSTMNHKPLSRQALQLSSTNKNSGILSLHSNERPSRTPKSRSKVCTPQFSRTVSAAARQLDVLQYAGSLHRNYFAS